MLPYQTRPTRWFKTILGAECEEYQNRILRAIVQHDRIAISACHDVGKSWTLARVVLWFGSCFPYSKIVTTAPTGRQVEKILWSEIKSAYARAKHPLGGRMLNLEWKINEVDWFAMGFSPANEASIGEGQGTQSTFQGFHAPYLLVVFDEATGVKPALWTMAEGLLTSHNVKFICIGNPTSTQSDFYKCFSDRSWFKIKLSCFDSPNLIANGITTLAALQAEVDFCKTLSDDAFLDRVKSYKVVKGHLLTLRWVVEKAIQWGMESALFLSKVLGEFPLEGDNVAIPLRVVEQAQQRSGYTVTDADRKTLGVDVARYGTDSTVFTPMHGPIVGKKKVINKRDTMQVVGEVVAQCWDGPIANMPDVIVVDEGGLGAGVVDRLEELRTEGVEIHSHVQIRGVNFGAGVECTLDGCDHSGKNKCERARYVNQKARMFDLLAKDMRSSIELPDEEVYQEELPSIQYKYDSKGRTYIESKDEFKKRTGRGSPDTADSLALANYGRYDNLTVGSFIKPNALKPDFKREPRSWASRKGKVNY